MINRVLIRLKIIQIVYAYYQNGSKNLDSAEKELFFSLSKAYDLYNYLLMLMIALTEYAQKRIDAAKAKLAPTKEELYPNKKFVENKFIAQLEVNKQLSEFIANQKRTWANDQDFVKELYEKIVETDIYKDYMASDDNSYEADRELWRKIYKTYIFNNDSLDQVLEDQSLYWNDDKEIVDTFVLKTIKRFDEKKGANQELLPEFKDDEDQEFARRLFRRTILNSDYYRHLVSENTKNWELDRIAFMDVIIMQTALAEILSFPNIPVSVSLNDALRKVMTSQGSPSRWCLPSIILWEACGWTWIPEPPWSICTQWVKPAATGSTERTAWPATACWKAWCLPGKPQKE